MKSAVSYTRSGHTSGVSWNLGSLLLDFFHLYGVSFNYQDLGISIRDGGSYFSKMHRVWSNAGRCFPSHFSLSPPSLFVRRQSILCIENPDYPDIDMGKNSFQMFKVRKAFEHGHQVLLVALQNRNTLSRRQNLSNYSVTDAGDDEAPAEQLQPSAEGSGDVSILAHLIRSDDEMLLNRFEEKKELLREWEAIQRRKERHLHSRGEEARSEGGGGGGERQPERKKQRRGEGIDFTVTGYEEARED
jgi:DNA polymerase sigma